MMDGTYRLGFKAPNFKEVTVKMYGNRTQIHADTHRNIWAKARVDSWLEFSNYTSDLSSFT